MHHLTIGSNTYEVVDQAGRASIAPDYDSTSTYAVGDLVLHEGQLYECSTAISTAEAWTAAHWTSKTVAAELSSLMGDLSNIQTATSGDIGKALSPKTVSSGTVTEWQYVTAGGGGSSVSPYTSNPAALGTASPGSSDNYARGDHVHPKPTAADLGITVPSASSATPQALGTASAGSSSDYSRADHVHAKPTASDIGAEASTNKVTSLSSSSTDTQYPSAKCVYDLIGDVESLLSAI